MKILLKVSAVVFMAIALVACNPLKKMDKYAESVKYSVTPDPLEMHGDSVAVSVTGKFPPKYFHKLATVVAKPVLKNAEGEVIKEFKEITLLGTDADGDGQKIDFEKGGSFTYDDKVAYDPSMENVTMFVNAVGSFKKKTQEFESKKIGDGTKTTPYWVQIDAKPILAKDNFKKIIPKSIKAEINFNIQSSQVQSAELRQDDMKAVNAFIAEGKEKAWVFKGASFSGYASPDGEMALNDNLANDRAKNARKAVERQLNRKKIAEAKADGFYTEIGKGEDWDGFKTAMGSSDIKDKDLILRVLSMYSDNTKREQEIKNMAATYVELSDKILPALRRTQITLNADEMARTDEEIQALSKSNPDTLSIEELLYGATLSNDIDEKMRYFQLAKKQYPKDWRGHNNVGYIYVLKNDMAAAAKEFQAAADVEKNSTVSNNLGVVGLYDGNVSAAKDMFTAAAGAGSEVDYNLGIIAIKEGSYATAVSKMGSENTLNSGLAKLLNGDNEGSLKAIDASDDKETAAGYYLKAVVGARTGNKDLMVKNLKSAIAVDGALKTKAANDAEFISFREDVAFTDVIK
ncbi:MAG: TPR end-of-group domain-containing protein [Salibacteraceae bacterium]